MSETMDKLDAVIAPLLRHAEKLEKTGREMDWQRALSIRRHAGEAKKHLAELESMVGMLRKTPNPGRQPRRECGVELHGVVGSLDSET